MCLCVHLVFQSTTSFQHSPRKMIWTRVTVLTFQTQRLHYSQLHICHNHCRFWFQIAFNIFTACSHLWLSRMITVLQAACYLYAFDSQAWLSWQFLPKILPKCLQYVYTSAHGSGRRYYVLLLKFLSFFFFFRQRISQMALPTGTFLAQMVGYRCNFKNWVQNLGGDPPLKFGGPNPQCCEQKSEDVIQTYCRNRLWERVSKTGFKILGLPPKNLRGVKV